MRARGLLLGAASVAAKTAVPSLAIARDTALSALAIVRSNATACLAALVASDVAIAPARCMRGARGNWSAQIVRSDAATGRLVPANHIAVDTIELPIGSKELDHGEIAVLRLHQPHGNGYFSVVKRNVTPTEAARVFSVLSIEPHTFKYSFQDHVGLATDSETIQLPSEVVVGTARAEPTDWRLLVDAATTTLFGFGLPTANYSTSNNASVFSWLPLAGGPLIDPWTNTSKSDLPSIMVLKPGSDDTSDSTAPSYMAGLRLVKDDVSFCGGSLISKTVVLTAAHCFDSGQVPGFVAIGSFYTAGDDDPSAEQIAVKSVLLHPQYNIKTKGNDVALVFLAQASTHSPIRLENAIQLDETTATVFGYGVTQAGGTEMSRTLRSVELPLVPSKQQCERQFGATLDATFLCAGGEEGRDACTGDSGGPLVLNPLNEPSLVGIVSAGDGCGVKGKPGLYTWVGSASVVAFVSTHVSDAKWTKWVQIQGIVIPLVQTGDAASSYPKLAISNSTTSEPVTFSPPLPSTTSTPTPEQRDSSKPVALFRVQLPDDLTKFTQSSLLQFLTTNSTNVTSSPGCESANVRFTLVSTQKLDALVNVIKRHDTMRLHRRRDRNFSVPH